MGTNMPRFGLAVHPQCLSFKRCDTNNVYKVKCRMTSWVSRLLKISPGYIYRMENEATVIVDTPTTYDGQVYRLICDDGHYYIGSTKTELKCRLYHHKQHSLLHSERKVYMHILSCGWEKVKIECVEEVKCNSREELVKRENEYIKQSLSDPLCLNINKAHLTKEELLEQQQEYLKANKEKVEAYHAKYRLENAEKRREYSAKYAAEHAEEVKAARHAHYEANKEEIMQKNKAYVEANKELVKQRKKAWAEKNKEKLADAYKVYAEENKEAIQKRGKEYYEKNKEVIQEKNKAYYEANKEASTTYGKEYREKNKTKLSESHSCDCGGKYTLTHREIHNASKRHTKFLAAAAAAVPTGPVDDV